MKITVVTLVFATTVAVFFGPPAAAQPPRCAAFPAFPDAGCTGPTGAFTPYNGSQQLRTNGQVIENVEIQTSAGIYLPASNVTFRNVRIVYTGPLNGTFTVINNQGQNNTFENVEIDGQGNVYDAINGSGTNLTVRNCNIHNVGRGVLSAGPMLIQDNYIHDITTPVGQSWHADGIMAQSAGAHDITVLHNTIILTGDYGLTGAINIGGTASAPATNIDIEHNLFAGGSYTMYTAFGENYRVINNDFSTRLWPKVGVYGIWYPGQEGIDREGNVIQETGASAND